MIKAIVGGIMGGGIAFCFSNYGLKAGAYATSLVLFIVILCSIIEATRPN